MLYNYNSTLELILSIRKNYGNEILAIALFGIGYFLFKLFNQRYRSKESVKGSKMIGKKQLDSKSTLYQYNLYIRDSLSHKPNLNPFEVLHQMQTENIIPDLTSYNTLLDVIFEQKNFDLGLKLFNEIKNSLCPVNPDIITYNTVIKGLSLKTEGIVGSQQIEEILQEIERVKDEISENDLKPNDITYNTMIDACVKSNNINKAFDFFEEMKKASNIKPDIFTYSTLIKGLKRPDSLGEEGVNLEKVFKIFQEIKLSKSVKIDEVIYNCVIDACFKFGNYQKAVFLYDDMIKSDIKPSNVTYGIMIKGYGQYKNLSDALKSYEKMKSEGLKLNEVTLGCLIDTCIKCDNLNKALNILESENEVKMNTIIYTTIIKGFTKEKNLEKAMQTLENMKKLDVKPNLVTFNSLLDCSVQCFSFEKMEKIYEEIMNNSSPSLQPDLITYSTYIKGLCKNRKVDQAFKLFLKLKEEKIYTLDEVIYNSLLDGLLKSKEYEKVSIVYDLMLKDQIKPSNVTYSIIIKLYSNQQKLNEALEILQQMKNEKIKPGLIVYTCLIQTCIKHKKIDKVISLYDEMIDNKVRGDVVFYNTLISGLIFNRELKNAVDITLFTLNKQMVLNNDVYNNIIKNLCKILDSKFKAQNLNKEEAEVLLLKLCQKMRNNNIEIDFELYNQIANLISRKNVELQEISAPKFNKSQSNRNQNQNQSNNNNNYFRSNKKSYDDKREWQSKSYQPKNLN